MNVLRIEHIVSSHFNPIQHDVWELLKKPGERLLKLPQPPQLANVCPEPLTNNFFFAFLYFLWDNF